MHETDVTRWRDIDNGVRLPTWVDFIGDPDGATYLSDLGHDVSRRMADDFDRFFGRDWLARAVGAGRNQVPMLPTLGKVSPVFATLRPEVPDINSWVVGNFIELTRWWASIKVMQSDPGFRLVRNQVRTNLELPNFLHALTQLRLAAIARSLGADSSVETFHGEERPRPQDVEVTIDGRMILIEVTTLSEARRTSSQLLWNFAAWRHMTELGDVHDVSWDGAAPIWDSDTEFEAWKVETAEAARVVGQTGISVLLGAELTQLEIRPGPAVGSTFSGSLPDVAVAERIRWKVEEKSRNASDLPAVWIWIENHGAIDPSHTFYHLPLEEKVQQFATVAAAGQGDAAAVLGASFSTGGGRTSRSEEPELAQARGARGLKCILPGGRRRETLHAAAVAGDDADFMWKVAQAEATWLDWALAEVDFADSVDSLFAHT